jgi:N-acetyl-alpha-D-glucosaminyl L-malate synthase BshA
LKRILDVIDVFEGILPKVKSKLMMVGEGPEKSKAMEYVKNKSLQEHVLFLGNSNEIDKILCFSDLFLLPSEKESFGLSALEAMAHGVPVISSNAGGIPEVNQHGVTGYLSNIGDTADMTQNALRLLENEKQHNLFKIQAQEQAQRFNINTIVSHYESSYVDAIASIQY